MKQFSMCLINTSAAQLTFQYSKRLLCRIQYELNSASAHNLIIVQNQQPTPHTTTDILCYKSIKQTHPIIALRRPISSIWQHGWIVMPTNEAWRRKITTKGWKIKVQWEVGCKSWIPFHVIQGFNPIEIAEFAIANNLDKEPTFVWWVHLVLRKTTSFIKKLRQKMAKSNLKFGLLVPKTIEETLALDKQQMEIRIGTQI